MESQGARRGTEEGPPGWVSAPSAGLHAKEPSGPPGRGLACRTPVHNISARQLQMGARSVMLRGGRAGALRAGTHRGRVVLGCGPGCWGASWGWPRPSVQGTKWSCAEPPLLSIPTQELGGVCSNTSPHNKPRHITAVRMLVALSLRSAQMLIHTYCVFHIDSIILCLSLCSSDNTVWTTPLTATPLPGERDSLA